MGKINCKILNDSGGLVNLEDSVKKWLSENPNIYIISTCGLPPGALAIFYGIKTKTTTPVQRDESGKPRCSTCHSVMVVRSSHSTGELFWGCPKYPDCRCSVPFTEEDFEREFGTEDPGKSSNDGKIPF